MQRLMLLALYWGSRVSTEGQFLKSAYGELQRLVARAGCTPWHSHADSSYAGSSICHSARGAGSEISGKKCLEDLQNTPGIVSEIWGAAERNRLLALVPEVRHGSEHFRLSAVSEVSNTRVSLLQTRIKVISVLSRVWLQDLAPVIYTLSGSPKFWNVTCSVPGSWETRSGP